MDSGAPSSEPPRRRVLPGEPRGALLTFLVLAAVGVPVGVIWSFVSPRVPVVITANGPDLVSYETDAFFANDGTFLFLGLGMGILTGIAGWLLVRRYRGPLLLLAVVLGSLAGAAVAWQVGRHIGLAHYHQLLHSNEVGRRVGKPVDLRGKEVLLGQPFAAALTYLLFAAWSFPGARHDQMAPAPPAS